MYEDPIVEETREGRRQLHEQFIGDRSALLEYLKQIERDNSGRVVTLRPRPVQIVRRRIS